MEDAKTTLRRIGTPVAYGVLGVLSTAIVGLVLLNVLNPVQVVVYDALYLQLGPTSATETAIFTHFLLSGSLALGATLFVGDYLSDRGAHGREILLVTGVLLAFVVVFIVVAVAGVAAFLTTLVVLVLAFVAVPLVLRYRFDVDSGALPAFAGGIPVVVLLVFLAGIGVGWGWGYVVTAEEVPASSVDSEAVSFDEVPEVRDDLFVTGDCETTSDGSRECDLQLRGYEHEATATRFLARHGVRCPYQNTHSGEADSFLALHDGTYYRITCSPHGD